VRLAVVCDAEFLHRFQQSGLSSRRRSVDFVRQEEVREDRAWPEFERAGLLAVNR
jgi:hypothetical protein